MKFLCLIIGIVVYSFSVYGQELERKNTFVIETNLIMTGTLSYDRLLPIAERTSIMLGGDYVMGVGFGYGAHWIAPELGVLLFGPKNFLETGVQYVFSIAGGNEVSEDEEQLHSPGIRIAYRRQSKQGFIFRTSINVYPSIDPIIVPAVGVGFSF